MGFLFRLFDRIAFRPFRRLSYWLDDLTTGWWTSLFAFPFRFVRGCYQVPRQLLVVWFESRQWRLLVYGIPFLASVVACASIAFAALTQRDDEVFGRYATAARRAFNSQQMAKGRLYADRLAAVGRADNELLLGLAAASAQLGDTARSELMLRELAPEDRAVYAPAHLAVARRLVAKRNLNEAEFESLVAHLRHTLTLDRANQEANFLLGTLYFQRGIWKSAIDHLERGKLQPEAKLMLGQALTRDGAEVRGRTLVQEAATAFEQAVRNDPSQVSSRQNWAEALRFIDRFPDAYSVLVQGLALRDSPELRLDIGRTCVLWSDFAGKSNEPVTEQLRILEQGLKVSSKELLLFDRLMKLLEKRGAGREQVRGRLHDLLAAGEVTPILHLVLGSDAFLTGSEEKAKYHLEQALALDEGMSVVANNLAWYLTFKRPPELERALELMNQILVRGENVPEYRETRGQILLRLGKTTEAMLDLEFALTRIRGNSELHAALAKGYEKLGQAELASKHLALSEKFAQGSSRSSSPP